MSVPGRKFNDLHKCSSSIYSSGDNSLIIEQHCSTKASPEGTYSNRESADESAYGIESSEEKPDIFCQPCEDDYQKLPAIGYCIDCDEYLCRKCYQHHCTPRYFKNHTLKDIKTSSPAVSRKKSLNDSCAQHPELLIEFYCKSHDQHGCGTCFATYHKKCDDTRYVEQEYEEVEKELTEIHLQTQEEIKAIHKHVTSTNTYLYAVIENIKRFREEINNVLDNLEAQITKKVSELKEKAQETLSTVSARADSLKSEIESFTLNLKTLYESKQRVQLFTDLDSTKAKLKTLRIILEKIKKENKVTTYTFEPDKDIRHLVKQSKALGTLVEKEKNETSSKKKGTDENIIQICMPPSILKSEILQTVDTVKETESDEAVKERNTKTLELPAPQEEIKTIRTASHIADINIKTSKDPFNCCVTGMALYSLEQLMIAADHANKQLKVINLKESEVVSDFGLVSQPWEVTKIKDSRVAVTLPFENIIQFITISSGVCSLYLEIKANGQCRGLAYNDEILLVSFLHPGKVDMINMNGEVVKSMKGDTHGKDIFPNPQHIAISPDNMTLYATDFRNDTVTKATLDGSVKAVYKAKSGDLGTPRGMAVDKTGAVFVCDSYLRNVLQIASSGRFLVLLGKDTITFEPWSITYCEREDKLYVGLNGDSVKVFQLE